MRALPSLTERVFRIDQPRRLALALTDEETLVSVSPEALFTWPAASNAATALGGYLATSTSEAENDFIFTLVGQDNSFWISDIQDNGIGPWLGGFQAEGSPEPSSGWAWVTGETFDYTNWAPGEPNNSKANENRIHLLGLANLKKNKDKTWNDYPDAPIAAKPSPISYIVEWSSDPSPKLSIQVSEVEICWTSVTNATYRVEYQSDLTTNAWVLLRECISSTGTETCIYDRILRGDPRKFYRVVLTNCVEVH